MQKLVKTNWRKKFKEYYTTPEKEKVLNKFEETLKGKKYNLGKKVDQNTV